MIRWTLVLLLFSGCQSVADGAREQFSHDQVCPLDRVEARARPELKPSQFGARPTAPQDVAADPGRLALWQAEQAKFAANDDAWGEIVEARGCDVHVFYSSGHPTRSSDGSRWMCTVESHVPDTISKW
jgi:hypothetical protein